MREVNPMGIFLIETKISDDRVQSVFRRLGFSFFVSFPPVRCTGGLAFCWCPGLVFDILMFPSSILHLFIQPGGGRVDFLCSFMYEPPLWRHKETFWKELASLNSFGVHPWVCTGDFNEVVKLSKKRGGRGVLGSSSKGLQNVLDRLGFVDRGFTGRNFTWTNG